MKLTLLKNIIVGVLCSFLFSCSEILLEKDISKEVEILVAPANNAQLLSTGVGFYWEKIPNATKYQLQIAKPDFINPSQILLDTITAANSFVQQLPLGNYEWRVRAVNSAYHTNYVARNFSVISDANFQDNILTLSTPENNLSTKTPLQNLSWQPIIGATNYQIQIYDKNNMIINDQTITKTNLNYTFSEGSYSWRVKALNGTKQTAFTSRSLMVDTTVPNIPILSSPTNASTTSNKSPSFQWSRTPIAGSPEKDSIYIYTDTALTTLKLKDVASSTPFSTSLSLGTYYWLMKSFDQAGNISAKSSVFSFTIN